MELVFEMVSAQQFVPGLLTSKSFRQAGGLIGRAEECDWAIPDGKRHLSNHHARVSYRDGAFYLTDISSNGIHLKDSGARLPRGEPQRIEHGSVYCLGDFEIRARLVQDPELFDGQIGRPLEAGSIIPDDAFLDLDPLIALDQEEPVHGQDDDLAMFGDAAAMQPRADYARIDMESLPLPELVPAPIETAPAPAAEADPDKFWKRFGEALGIDICHLDQDSREDLAVQTARLLWQSIAGLQQSLRTRSELKNELRLALTTVQSAGNNPLKQAIDNREAMAALLLAGRPGQLPAEQAIARAFRDLQAHQVAMLSASRAALRATLEHFAPESLALRFERDGHRSLLPGSGGLWRAFSRYHRSLQQDDDWSERLLARDFARTYEEQVRLIATLDTENQG
ncbi:type VI secretion system-associated FHA domain protein TagH [Pseudomonas schmalbachii]|uniref:Type VI secretion system-associated FHA domain protein TagH n=1 Tax=Pseudomonas schmalbachii TaxID=2816993 RepID=A0ABS3TUK0_9PSED|nr:type VI secretion system-associated FHA domain protein TagH [Pseudomonas schmalbachii]MBO3277355.1 type VI secretion system-associated FHA domain protein TagH [Pseudomonas schmalbachii]